MVWQHFVKGILGGFTASEVGTRWDNHVCHSTSQQLFGQRQKYFLGKIQHKSELSSGCAGWLVVLGNLPSYNERFSRAKFVKAFLLILTLLPLVRCKLLKMGNWGSKKRVFEGGFECVLKGKVEK